MIRSRQLIIFLITLLVSIYIYYLTNNLSKETVFDFLNQFGVWVITGFIVLNIISYIILPVSNAPLLLAGFYLFEANSVWYLSIAMFISMITNYWIARFYGKRLVKYLAGPEHMEHVDNFAEHYSSHKMFFLLRIFQGGMHKFVSYALGLSTLPFWPYLLISALTLPVFSLAWYWWATTVNNPITFLLITQVLGAIPPTFFLVAMVGKRGLRKRNS